MTASSAAIQTFAAASAAIVDQTKPLATALPANTAQVWPGGATFSTISAAIASITGASPKEQYQVAVGPGTYNERVTMIDNIYIIGAGVDVTIITAAGTNAFSTGTIVASANSGVSECSIVATGGGWGTCPTGVSIQGNGLLHLSGVSILATDSGNAGNNVRCLTNNEGTYAGSVIVGQSTINAVSSVESSVAVCFEGFAGGTANSFSYFINLSKVLAQCAGGQQSYGVSVAAAASVTLDNSSVTATTWSLYNSDGISPITANQCTLVGPVSGGVVVNR